MTKIYKQHKQFNLNFFSGFIYLILERGREGEREGKINVWLPLKHPLLGTWPTNSSMCPNW